MYSWIYIYMYIIYMYMMVYYMYIKNKYICTVYDICLRHLSPKSAGILLLLVLVLFIWS